MRSRARTFRRRPRRDSDGLAPISSGRYRAVPLPRFRREVVALLIAASATAETRNYPKLDSTQALRLVIKWDKMLRLRHSQGKPPCNVSDHILKFEKQGVVCPCGSSAGRDAERGPCRRCTGRDPGKAKMGFFSKVARDIQVIIKDSGSSKPKRQRFNPAKKRKGKFVRKKPFGGNFSAKMRKKYGDQATSLNTETQRDPSTRGRSQSYRQGYLAGREDAKTREGATDVLSAANAYRVTIRDYMDFCDGYVQHMPLKRRAFEKNRVRRWVDKHGSDNRASGYGRPGMRPPSRIRRLTRKSRRTSRDLSADDLRGYSLQALGRLLRLAIRNGNEHMQTVVEREIDRRTKDFR